MQNNLDEIEDYVEQPIPYWAITVSAVLLFGFLPLTAIWGLGRFFAGPVWFESMPIFSTLFRMVAYCGFAHFILIWPFTQKAYPQIAAKPDLVKIAIGLLLLCPPLMSYAYYRGGVKEVMDLQEIFLLVVPSVACGLLFYVRTEVPYVLSLFVGITTFIPLFVTNDVLGHFPVLFTYGSNGPWFYCWRTLFPLAAVWFAIASTRETKADKMSARGFAYGSLGVVALAIVLEGLLPLAVALYKKESPATYVQPDFTWVLSLLAAGLLWNPSGKVYHLLLTVCAVEWTVVTFRIAKYLLNFDSTFWQLSWFTVTAFGWIFLGWLLFSLVKKRESFI